MGVRATRPEHAIVALECQNIHFMAAIVSRRYSVCLHSRVVLGLRFCHRPCQVNELTDSVKRAAQIWRGSESMKVDYVADIEDHGLCRKWCVTRMVLGCHT